MQISSEYLDLAIGLAAVFFLASLAVSALADGIQWPFRVRSKFLWAYLHDLTSTTRGDHKLPRGKRGILALWGKRNDQRPRTGQDARTPDEQQHAAVTAEGGGLKQVAQALDPIDAPQLMTQPGEAEGLRRTTIQNVPPASLAQAFLEVFAEVGRAPADEAMTAFATAIANGDQPAIDDAASAVGRLLQPDEADPPIVVDLRRFAGAVDEAIDDAALVAAGADLAAALHALPAESPQQFSAETVDLARAVRPERPGSPPTSRPVAESARRLVTRIMRARPERFSRERVDVALEQLGESPLGVTTRRLWDGTKRELDNFRGALEHYFDSEMSRLSGYYKRSIRIVLIVLSVVVTLVANIDALDVANGLWRNPDGRAALIAQADQLATGGPAGEEDDASAVDEVTLARLQRECSRRNPLEIGPDPDPDAVAAGLQEVRTCVDDALTVLSGLGVIDSALWISPSRWRDDFDPSFRTDGENGGDWLLHTVGVALTAGALVLGSSFWFDLIKRLTGLRRRLVGQT